MINYYHFRFTAYTENNILRRGFVTQIAESRESARELVKIELKKLNIRLKELEDYEDRED